MNVRHTIIKAKSTIVSGYRSLKSKMYGNSFLKFK